MIITNSACCENFQDFVVISSSGGTNGQTGGTGYGGGGTNSNHSSGGKHNALNLCKGGLKKNGKCKKNGRRRREDGEDSSDADMICIIRAGYNVVNAFEKKPIKDCFIDHLEENF